MRGTYIMLILLVLCTFGVVVVQGETNEERDIVKSAEIAKESVNEALSSIIYAVDATMKACSAIYNALTDLWNIVASKENSTQPPSEEPQIYSNEEIYT
jgi:hypothetical protein